MTEADEASHVRWWAEAVLCLGDTRDDAFARRMGRGPLGEMVSLAMARPAQERERLFIALEGTGRPLPWEKVAALAARADCPLII